MSKGFFHTHFPPPEALKMPVIGVDISDESIHAVQLEMGHSGLEMDDVMHKTIEDGVMQEGKILDMSAFIKALTEFRKENKLYLVNVSLPEQHGYIFTIDVPQMKKSEVRDYIEMHVEENVPIPIADAVFDYAFVQGGKKDDETMSISVSVYPRDIVEQYLAAFEESGYQVMRIEIEANAIARSVVSMKDKSAVMILDLGKTRTGIYIVSGQVVQFSSTISIGGDEFTRAIANVKSVPEEEAEELKQKYGIQLNNEDKDVTTALLTIATMLRDEIKRRYVYWNTHNTFGGEKRNKIEKIVLCGGNANLVGLTEFMNEQINVPVSIANVFVNVNEFENYIPQVPIQASLRYSTAIGLALKQY